MTTALVTGASAGIGRAFARALAARGHDLVLVARDADRLAELATVLERDHHVTVASLPADLLTAHGVATVVARLADDRPPVELLVNNAGVGAFGRFDDLDLEQQVAAIELNTVTVVRLTRAAVDVMARRGSGAVVNVSSIAGYQPTPDSAVYGATKAFVTSFTHAVHEEMRGSGVHVMLLCPGFTHTELHDRAGLVPIGLPELMWQSADEVAAAALRDLDHGRAVSIPGRLNQAAVVASRVTPTVVTRRVAAVVMHRLGRPTAG
jgi:uncharacterized protein